MPPPAVGTPPVTLGPEVFLKVALSERWMARALAPRSDCSFLKRSSSERTSTGMATWLSAKRSTEWGLWRRTLVSRTKCFLPVAGRRFERAVLVGCLAVAFAGGRRERAESSIGLNWFIRLAKVGRRRFEEVNG